MGIQDRQHLEVKSVTTLRNWLKKNHLTSMGCWVVTFKKDSGQPVVTYDEMVMEILCFGWIDSVPGKVDELRTKRYISPRKKGSAWSAVNKKRIPELIKLGRMQPAGLLAIEAAKKDGSWVKLDAIEASIVPADLINALKKNSDAKKYFDKFAPSSKKAILQWIEHAKTPNTREKRIIETVACAARNVRANNWLDKGK